MSHFRVRETWNSQMGKDLTNLQLQTLDTSAIKQYKRAIYSILKSTGILSTWTVMMVSFCLLFSPFWARQEILWADIGKKFQFLGIVRPHVASSSSSLVFFNFFLGISSQRPSALGYYFNDEIIARFAWYYYTISRCYLCYQAIFT